MIIGSSIGLPLNLEHQYPVSETEYRTSLQLIIRPRMTNHLKASFKICKEMEGRYKITCRLTRIHVEVCQRLKDSYTLKPL